MRLTIFLLLLYNVVFGQSSFHALISEGQTEKLPFVTGDLVSIPGTDARAQHAFNLLVAPNMWYDSGKTHMAYQTPVSGSLNILTYDDRYGLSKPIRMYPPRDAFDVHHRPCIIADGDTLYMLAEQNHNDEPIDILRTRHPNDELVWELSATKIGTIPTYPHFARQGDNGNLVGVGQFDVGSDANSSFNMNSSGYVEGTWTNEEQIGTRIASPALQVENEHYSSAIINEGIVTNRVPFTVTGRTNAGIWFRKYLIRGDFESGTQTYYNWDESFSKSSQLTASELNANFLYYSTTDNTEQAWVPSPALDDFGNFYDMTGDGAGGLEFVYWLTGDSSPTIKTASFPNIEDAGDGQNGPVMLMFATSTDAVYAIIGRDSLGFRKPFLYRTENLGDTWEEIGDMLPTVNDSIKTVLIPHNYKQIRNNKNFIICFVGYEAPTFANLYILRAAFGTVQTTDDGNPYDDVTAYSESEYNALLVRSYFIEAGKVTNTGTTLNTAIDQSASAQDMTTAGSPVMDHATTPTYVTMDGTNDRGIIPTTGLTTATEGMIIVVADGADATTQHMVSAANTGATNRWLSWGKSSTDVTRHVKNTNEFQIRGLDDVSDAPHIFVFLHQNGNGTGGTNVLHFLDGKLQKRDIETGTTGAEGTFLGDIPSGISNISVGALVRNTSAFYNMRIYHVGIATSPMSYEQLRRSIKFLSNEYSITVSSDYE